MFVISYPGYVIISGALSDHVLNDLYHSSEHLVHYDDFFDCSRVHIYSRRVSVQMCRAEIQSWRLLSLLYAPSSCLIKACIINPTIFESFFLSLCRYDCYIKGKLFCSNSHLMFLS